jgi:hypothetical protein
LWFSHVRQRTIPWLVNLTPTCRYTIPSGGGGKQKMEQKFYCDTFLTEHSARP